MIENLRNFLKFYTFIEKILIARPEIQILAHGSSNIDEIRQKKGGLEGEDDVRIHLTKSLIVYKSENFVIKRKVKKMFI